MTTHLGNLVEEIISHVSLKDNDTVVDIGSNDGTLLKAYPQKFRLNRIGIDASGHNFTSYYNQDNLKLVTGYFSLQAFREHFGIGAKVKIVTSISMFYDLPDPLKFARDVKQILEKDGIWVTEQSYILSMLKKNSFDTVCHEHLEYYALKQFDYICAKADLKIINVSLNECNGGSFRITMTHRENSAVNVSTENIENVRKLEAAEQLDTLKPYKNFELASKTVRDSLVTFIRDQKNLGKSIYLYGASTKGNTLLQYCNIDNSLITFAAERNTEKYGRRTPKTNIPIISEAEARVKCPDYFLVLPWHFKSEFLEREQVYLNNGGQFIFPLPEISLLSSRKRAFITGLSGQIGQYLKNVLLEKNYIVYGSTRNLKNNEILMREKFIHLFELELLNQKEIDKLKSVLDIISPDCIYNLASESDAVRSIEKPLETINLNGFLVCQLCETIYELQKRKHKEIRFFQASSAELFKGSNNRMVNETQIDFHPKNPYGLGKLLAHWTVRYYREFFGLHASNGLIFTTESALRNPKFAIRKIARKVAEIHSGRETDLTLGDLNALRDWIHAGDVATAAFQIVNQREPSDYVISLGSLHTLKDAVDHCFSKIGVQLKWNDTVNGDQMAINKEKPEKIYVKTDQSLFRTYETDQQKLLGDNSKLKSIGWKPKYNFSELIEDVLGHDKALLVGEKSMS